MDYKELLKEQKNLSRRRAEILLSSFVERNTKKTDEMLKIIAEDIGCNVDDLDFSIESQKLIFSWLYKDAKFDESITEDELPDWCQYKPYFLLKLNYSSEMLWKIDFFLYYLGQSIVKYCDGEWGLFELLGARGDYNGRWGPCIMCGGRCISTSLILLTDSVLRSCINENERLYFVPLNEAV